MTATEETDVGLQPYPAYRASGVPWLGEVPSGWEVHRLKQVARHVARGESPSYAEDGEVWVINQACVRWAGVDFSRKKFQDAGAAPGKGLLEDDDVLINSTGNVTLGRSTVFRVVPGQVCMADNHVTIVRTYPDRLLPTYFNYLVSTTEFQRFIYATLVVGATAQIELSRSALRDTSFPTPSLSEQRAIVTFLDHETARIDELLGEQEALLGELALRRDAVISEGATKGLGGVPLRESGITWAGQVPAHWEFVKLRSVARLESGHTPSRSRPEYWENCTIPWVSLSDVRRFRDGRLKYIEDTEEKISELGMAHSAARLLPRGTVILSRTASVGFSAILGADMATTQDFANWVCGPRLLPEYLLYVLRGMKHEFARLMMGSTHQTIYMPDIRELQIPLPPLGEQQAIVQRLDTQLAQIDTLTAEVRASIALMRQHRSALITSAVTGKIDVRQA